MMNTVTLDRMYLEWSQFTEARTSREQSQALQIEELENRLASLLAIGPQAKVTRPNWTAVYRGSVHTYDRDEQLVPVTRETLRIAVSAIKYVMAQDAYQHQPHAIREIEEALA